MKTVSLALLGLSLVACGGKPTTDSSSDTGGDTVDADGDGFDSTVDCDDDNANINPDAEEVCDGADNNCDGVADEETAVDAGTWYADSDADSYGDATASLMACDAPEGYVADGSDCDDSDAAVNPETIWYGDVDADGFGSADDAAASCEQPTGYVANSDDCDDSNADVNPDGVEICDGLDNDCDSSTSEDGMATHLDASGVSSDVTADVSGTMASPAAYTVSEGELHFCDGTFYTHLTVDGDASVASVNQDPTRAIVDGGGMGRPITVIGEAISVSISDLMVTGGVGALDELSAFGGTSAAGGVGCLGYDIMSGSEPIAQTNLTIENAIISGNSAESVGGLMSIGCNLVLSNSEVSNNTGEFGGGLITFDGQHTLTGVEVTDNSAFDYAGGGFASLGGAASAVTLDDTVYSGNENTGFDGNYSGGILAIVEGTSVTWTGTAGAGGSGIWGNVAPEYGALEFIDEGSLVVDTVDFGVADDGTGNTDIDITIDDLREYWVGYDDASFTCTADECGVAVETELLADPNTVTVQGLYSNAFGAPFTVDSTGTLNSIELLTQASVSGCSMKFSMLSRSSSSSTTWDVEWTDTVGFSTTEDWVSSGPIGRVLDESLEYAWHWEPLGCAYLLYVDIDYSSYYSYYGGSPTPIAIPGLGEYTTGYLYNCTESGSDTLICSEPNVGVTFGLRFSVTEL